MEIALIIGSLIIGGIGGAAFILYFVARAMERVITGIGRLL